MPPGFNTAAPPASTSHVDRRDRPAARVTTTANPNRRSTSGNPTPVGCTDEPTDATPASKATAHTKRRSITVARRMGGGGRARSLLARVLAGHRARHHGGRELERRRRSGEPEDDVDDVDARPDGAEVAGAVAAPSGGGGSGSPGMIASELISSGPIEREPGVGRRRRRVPTSASRASSAETSRSASAPGAGSGSPR